jgi:dGTP triphosphohydrolase
MTIEGQVGVDRANGGRAFADRGRDSFGRSGADVADGEQPRVAGLERQRGKLKDFLFTNLYRRYRVVRMGDKAGRVLRDLFLSYVGEPLQLPPHYQERIPRDGVHRVVCDYIAGMTDRFAVDEHRKLFDPMERV